MDKEMPEKKNKPLSIFRPMLEEAPTSLSQGEPSWSPVRSDSRITDFEAALASPSDEYKD